MEYRDNFENEVLTMYLSGRITAENAEELEAGVMHGIEEYKPSHAVVDLEETEYISSAGLRVIMKIVKMDIKVDLINAGDEIYEVLDMTGFTRMTEVGRK